MTVTLRNRIQNCIAPVVVAGRQSYYPSPSTSLPLLQRALESRLFAFCQLFYLIPQISCIMRHAGRIITTIIIGLGSANGSLSLSVPANAPKLRRVVVVLLVVALVVAAVVAVAYVSGHLSSNSSTSSSCSCDSVDNEMDTIQLPFRQCTGNLQLTHTCTHSGTRIYRERCRSRTLSKMLLIKNLRSQLNRLIISFWDLCELKENRTSK